ncbi:caspase domain-containing protein [Armillaria borealis]|uniref:Caspase domain-containing protein n=1 Tax=Armillaria borealis TaxID=47425 RepID=A0AA39JQJ1_9AGAR|nr:caspase domain-containing protein [Armillaria borealis]
MATADDLPWPELGNVSCGATRGNKGQKATLGLQTVKLSSYRPAISHERSCSTSASQHKVNRPIGNQCEFNQETFRAKRVRPCAYFLTKGIRPLIRHLCYPQQSDSLSSTGNSRPQPLPSFWSVHGPKCANNFIRTRIFTRISGVWTSTIIMLCSGVDIISSATNHPSPQELDAQHDIVNSSILDLCLSPDRIWAVLVGIDGYASYPLRGCVADALTMEQYLVKDLLVPRERIQTLLGPANDTPTDMSSIPSRVNILSLLLSLTVNPDIEHGDPIIIFFAGHGSRYPLSDEDDDPDFDEDEHSQKFVEALCPVDRKTIDSSGRLIPDITDRELNTILAQISRTKGHRITFILDCCHAGSVTRTSSPGVRTVPPLEHVSLKNMLLAAEDSLRDLPGYRSVFADDWVPDMDSHVILAACMGNEVAKAKWVRKMGAEVWGGVFTNLLVKTLRSGVLGEGATYVDLIKALPRLHFQTPIVAGGHENTRLWYQS